jgi:PKD repeat protein
MKRKINFAFAIVLSLCLAGLPFSCKEEDKGSLPVAQFTFTLTAVNTITFVNATDAATLINPTYLWNFGFVPAAGSPALAQTTQRDPGAVVFPAEGSYEVSLTVKSDAGQNVRTQTVVVRTSNAQKLAGFSNTTGKRWRWDTSVPAFPNGTNVNVTQYSDFTNYPRVSQAFSLNACQAEERYQFFPDGRYVVVLGTAGQVAGAPTGFSCGSYAGIPDSDNLKPLLTATWTLADNAPALTPAVSAPAGAAAGLGTDTGLRLNTGRAFLGNLSSVSFFARDNANNDGWIATRPNVHIIRQLTENVMILEYRRAVNAGDGSISFVRLVPAN